MSKVEQKKRKQRDATSDIVTRDYTINLHKRIHDIGFKKRAPRAVSEIRKFAELHMGTKDVRIDSDLNKAVWSHGIKNVPFRLRIRLARKRNENEDAKEKLYTLVSHVNVASVKGLQTETFHGESSA
eukprot:m.220741 g.220741  ORF g.220741 m.220741 type:complete len:127 (+) comp15641_c0_seq1:49-429(+)